MCILGRLLCDNTCPIFNLFAEYFIIDKQKYIASQIKQSCDINLHILMKKITEQLMFAANPKNIRAAHSLLSLPIYNAIDSIAILELCSNALFASIAHKFKDSEIIFDILRTFKHNLIMLRNDKTVDETIFTIYEGNYYSALFQLLHNQRCNDNYKNVIARYDKLNVSNSIKLGLAAQTSSSLYLLGKREHDTSSKIKSRDWIYKLYGSLDNSEITAQHYFVLAKLIEHHTESNLFYEVTDVVNNLASFLDAGLEDDNIVTVDEAVKKVIFHRDAYRALKMVDDVRYNQHYDTAITLAEKFELTDQIDKINKIKGELEKVTLYIPGLIENDHSTIHKDVISHFNPHKPYVFISYCHKDVNLVKQDIDNILNKYNYWIDYENIDGGRNANEDDWVEKILPILDSEFCTGIIVYCSRNSIKALGTLREINWLYRKNTESKSGKDFFTVLCGFQSDFTPIHAKKFLENIDLTEYDNDPSIKADISKTYNYILQTNKDATSYSYYFWNNKGTHFTSGDFLNWLKKISVKSQNISE